MTKDHIDDALRALRADLPEPRRDLNESEKDALIAKLGGPRTVASILKAKDSLPLARIPFLFSSLDTRSVLEVLANDMTAALQRARPNS